MVRREQQSTPPPIWDQFQNTLLVWPRLLEQGVKFQWGILEAVQESVRESVDQSAGAQVPRGDDQHRSGGLLAASTARKGASRGPRDETVAPATSPLPVRRLAPVPGGGEGQAGATSPSEEHVPSRRKHPQPHRGTLEPDVSRTTALEQRYHELIEIEWLSETLELSSR